MNLAGWFRRKKGIDNGAYDRAVSLPIPDGARDVPFDVRLPLTQATTIVLSHVVFLILILGVEGVLVGAYTPTATEIAGVVVSLILIIASSYVRGGLNPDRRLHISEEGVRVDQVLGTQSVQWWNVVGISAKRDLSRFRVGTNRSSISIQTSGLNEARRVAILVALRARLATDQPLQEWRPSLLSRDLLANTAATVGSFLFVWSFVLLPALGGTLGVRCSGPSSYLDSRFGLPPRQNGCVVVRVSGAAARAGVRQGDRMISMNGTPVTSGAQFNDLFDHAGSREFDFVFVRSGVADPINVHVALGSGSSATTPDSDPLAWFLRARGNSNRQQSIDQYTQAIELAPEFDLAYLFRGEFELDNGDAAAGLRDVQRALSLNQDSAEANRTLARYYEDQFSVDATVPKSYIERAIRLHGCDGGFVDQNLECEQDYVALAELLRFRADARGSIDAAKQAIPFYPKAASPLYQLAFSYGAVGDTVESASYARQYLSNARRTESGSKNIRQLLARLGSPTPARTP